MSQALARSNEFPEMLKVREAAAIARVGSRAIYRCCRSNGFPCVKIGCSIRIPKAAFLKWLEEQASK